MRSLFKPLCQATQKHADETVSMGVDCVLGTSSLPPGSRRFFHIPSVMNKLGYPLVIAL